MKKHLATTLAVCCLLAAFSMPASALEYSFDGPEAGLFGTPTSEETIFVGVGEAVNTNRSKDAAYIPPTFGSLTSYTLGTWERLTPNLISDSAGGTVSGTGGVTVMPPSYTESGSTNTGSASTGYTAVTDDLYYSGGHLGTLKIPSIGLTVKVYEGTDSTALRNGAGHFEGTSIWDGNVAIVPTISYVQYLELNEMLKKKNNPALLPIQIAYYTGLRIGEVCSLTWQDINLKEQYLTVRRSIRYNSTRHKTEISSTKRRKIRTVDFCDTLAKILSDARKQQMLNRLACGELYRKNYYLPVKEKNRTYYEVYTLPVTEQASEEYQEVSFVCLRQDGSYESPSAVSAMCRKAKKRIDGMEEFHFHQLRHTFTSNLLSNGAPPKDVQELLGHSQLATTMNIYAHTTREAKRTSARLLDKVQ